MLCSSNAGPNCKMSYQYRNDSQTAPGSSLPLNNTLSGKQLRNHEMAYVLIAPVSQVAGNARHRVRHVKNTPAARLAPCYTTLR